ncbi:MAG: cation acetate symporter [Bacteroidales bacterium]|nr:cation acetate symporter [Bacteroidales bacterium]MDD4217317.1 cation acetate symporter [Bacteroidales bacterium]
MIYDVSIGAIIIFVCFVVLVLILSFYFARKTKTANSYYAAGGTIHWSVNGIAFAGDYLSAASFLGICGMIAYAGYDGFLYSIGYLAGWVVALFVVAEPLKRMGKFTFADALDNKFNSKGIKLTAAISTLIVSLFYLIPQMVGAGDLVVPLLGLPHWVGVVIVGSIVILIVATAGMTSTTYVQFIKGGMLIIVTVILTVFILNKGLDANPHDDYHVFTSLEASFDDNGKLLLNDDSKAEILYVTEGAAGKERFAKMKFNGYERWFRLIEKDNTVLLEESLSVTDPTSGDVLYNGAEKSARQFYQVGHMYRIISEGQEVESTGGLNPFKFLTKIEDSEIIIYTKAIVEDGDDRVSVYYPKVVPGTSVMKPGMIFKLANGTGWDKLNFISLMLALFLGTSALPHILIRYYTVPSQRAARKSTIVAIAAIGFFYILTLFLGFGAMINGVIDVTSSNMSGPLLAKMFGVGIFSLISAIAFATVLGTVSGLIVASSGAIAHDFIDNYLNKQMTDKAKVRAGKISAFVVGIIAIILGILFQGMNVSFLVGLAFAVAASANLPAIIMILFWKKTTSKGVSASIVTGIASSIILILLSPTMFERYGMLKTDAIWPLDNPGIVSIPLSFAILVVVSLLTKKKETQLGIVKE